MDIEQPDPPFLNQAELARLQKEREKLKDREEEGGWY